MLINITTICTMFVRINWLMVCVCVYEICVFHIGLYCMKHNASGCETIKTKPEGEHSSKRRPYSTSQRDNAFSVHLFVWMCVMFSFRGYFSAVEFSSSMNMCASCKVITICAPLFLSLLSCLMCFICFSVFFVICTGSDKIRTCVIYRRVLLFLLFKPTFSTVYTWITKCMLSVAVLTFTLHLPAMKILLSIISADISSFLRIHTYIWEA